MAEHENSLSVVRYLCENTHDWNQLNDDTVGGRAVEFLLSAHINYERLRIDKKSSCASALV